MSRAHYPVHPDDGANENEREAGGITPAMRALTVGVLLGWIAGFVAGFLCAKLFFR